MDEKDNDGDLILNELGEHIPKDILQLTHSKNRFNFTDHFYVDITGKGYLLYTYTTGSRFQFYNHEEHSKLCLIIISILDKDTLFKICMVNHKRIQLLEKEIENILLMIKYHPSGELAGKLKEEFEDLSTQCKKERS
jgi:hypothetical protein